MKKIIVGLLFAVLLLNEYSSSAQDVHIFRTLGTEEYKFPTGLNLQPLKQKKRFWRAAGELLLVQVIPWSVNKFVRKAEFANITFKSIGHNLQPKNWVWDDNSFSTNQFAHPYHGNLYFNAFRTNGYNFWESAPAALAGSFLWEVVGETHPPAPNDLINTTFGGIVLGEMTYRLSQTIFRKRRNAKSPFMTDLYAMMVNPMGGFNRILDNQWGKPYPIYQGEYIPISTLIDGGYRRTGIRDENTLKKGRPEYFFRFNIQYGNPFQNIKVPFRSFNIVAEIGNSDSARLNTLLVEGVLHAKELRKDSRISNYFFVTMNYEFYKNTALNYGSMGFQTRFVSNIQASKMWQFRLRAGIGLIGLAATPNKYLYYGEGRNYDYGPGISINFGAGVRFGGNLFYTLNYRGGFSKTINGANSNYFLETGTSELRWAFAKHFSLYGETGFFRLKANYKEYPNVNDRFKFFRLALGYITTL